MLAAQTTLRLYSSLSGRIFAQNCVSVFMNQTNSLPDAAPTTPSSSTAQKAGEDSACQHCGALVYGDNIRCPQCGKFPIRMHQCPRCKSIAAASAERCWKCGRTFEPDGDFL